ncbi:MAG: hypothetical protein ACK5NN_03820 [Sphingomonadaceae bacterium]
MVLRTPLPVTGPNLTTGLHHANPVKREKRRRTKPRQPACGNNPTYMIDGGA